jgi:hypothetical protein
MPVAAPNANHQIAVLQRAIKTRLADGKLTLNEARQLLAQAKKENVQVGELGLLRGLAKARQASPRAKDFLVREVDQIVPAGAPTAQLAAILFRLDPATGRNQLLSLLDHAKNPVAGGPTTFVVTGLGRPYLAAITTAQVTMGLVKFLDGASAPQATKIRHLLNQQLKTLLTPVARGGLAVPGMLGATNGLASSDDTREGGIIAVNQQAVVLRALERVIELKGPRNAAIAAKARAVGRRVARELKAELDFTYPATGRLAYSLAMRSGHATTMRLEDGNHLKTTLDALKAMTVFGDRFAPAMQRIERRLPEIALAGPEDLSGRAGRIYSDEFNAFRAQVAKVKRGGVSAGELERLQAFAQRDGLLTPGERGVLARLKRSMV